jgi:signal transduction histidine kinase
MNSMNRTIFIISADPVVAHQCMDELGAFGGRYRTTLLISVEQARTAFLRTAPVAVFLDESSIDTLGAGDSFESVVSMLTEMAPVVVAAAPDKQAELAFLIRSGAVDFVSRVSHFIPVAADMLKRRARIADRVAGMIQFPTDELTGDFGEILRHEVNNPLTGILGNTELLLARRDRLPPGAAERLQTIAELAVRLRETVRRLSNAWDEHHEHAKTV